MKSKLKLKNRKKSEATPEFLNKEIIDDCDSDVTSNENNEINENKENDQTRSEQIRSNITDLANNHQE